MFSPLLRIFNFYSIWSYYKLINFFKQYPIPSYKINENLPYLRRISSVFAFRSARLREQRKIFTYMSLSDLMPILENKQ